MFPGDHFYIHTSTDLLHALRRDVFERPVIKTRWLPAKATNEFLINGLEQRMRTADRDFMIVPLKACAGTTRVTFSQVLRRQPFFALWLARFISSIGDWLALLPLFSLIAFQRHGSAAETSMVMVSFSVPVILLGSMAGAFVDRSNLKRTLIICDLICAVLAVLLAFSGHLYQMYLLMAGLQRCLLFFPSRPNRGTAVDCPARTSCWLPTPSMCRRYN